MRKFRDKRNLKVYELSGYQYKAVPTIKLKGIWLKELGFESGTPITVICESGRLTIERANETDNSFMDVEAVPVMCSDGTAGFCGKEAAYV